MDRLGIVASTMCALHCVLGPVIIGATGAGLLFADERLEAAFVAIAILVAACALTLGYRRHRHQWPMTIGTPGIVSLCVARLIEFDVESTEVVFSVAGAGLLVGAYWLNLHRFRQATACCAPDQATTVDAQSRPLL